MRSDIQKARDARRAAPAAPASNVVTDDIKNANITMKMERASFENRSTQPQSTVPKTTSFFEHAGNAVATINRGINSVVTNPHVQRAGKYLKDRSISIANEMQAQDRPTRKQKPRYRSDKYDADNMTPADDLFGVVSYGSSYSDHGDDYRDAPIRKQKRRKQKPKQRFDDTRHGFGGIRYPKNPF